MIYLDNQFVLYSPLDIEYDKDQALAEAKNAIDNYGAWISSKGIKLQRPDVRSLSAKEADYLEKQSRQIQQLERPNDFPVKGVLLRGIKGLKYSFSYLVTDTSLFDWTDISNKCPTIVDLVNKLPFERLGRVNIQTVEAGMSLHKHVDSVFRIDSETTKRRNEHLSQYGITDFNMDVDCLITIVFQGNGINFYFHRSGEKIKVSDSAYYFCPQFIHHSIDKTDQQRIICRVEGKASTQMSDWIQENAKRNADRVIVL